MGRSDGYQAGRHLSEYEHGSNSEIHACTFVDSASCLWENASLFDIHVEIYSLHVRRFSKKRMFFFQRPRIDMCMQLASSALQREVQFSHRAFDHNTCQFIYIMP